MKKRSPTMNDVQTRFCHRTDHIVKNFCEKGCRTSAQNAEEIKRVVESLDSLPFKVLTAKIKEHGITVPNTQNPLMMLMMCRQK